jgi:antitoxin component YwqK of YwqJK toxin-antitoxin module
MKIKLLFLLLLFTAGWSGALLAQNLDEEQQTMREYKLPEQSVAETSLVERDSLMQLDGKPFTGTAYSRFPNGQLQNATQYQNGLKQGYMLVWYPDGRPQLMSNYKKGYLNGVFKGWYQFGGVIYNLVMKSGAYSGDQRYESDTGRETAATEDTTPGADGKDQANDKE